MSWRFWPNCRPPRVELAPAIGGALLNRYGTAVGNVIHAPQREAGSARAF